MNIVSFVFKLNTNFIIILKRALAFSRNEKKNISGSFYTFTIYWLQQNECFHSHLKCLNGTEYDNMFGMFKILVGS